LVALSAFSIGPCLLLNTKLSEEPAGPPAGALGARGVRAAAETLCQRAERPEIGAGC